MLGPCTFEMYSCSEMDCSVLGDRTNAFIMHISGYLVMFSFLVMQEACL